jgi:hypothetical protein
LREAKRAYSLIESHNAILNLPALGLTNENQVAVLYHHNREQHEHARDAAYTRGIINLGYFPELEPALQWLQAAD